MYMCQYQLHMSKSTFLLDYNFVVLGRENVKVTFHMN